MDNWNKHFFRIIKDNSDKPWDWYHLSQNPNITWDIVEANLDKPWDLIGLSLSQNPNITCDIIVDEHMNNSAK